MFVEAYGFFNCILPSGNSNFYYITLLNNIIIYMIAVIIKSTRYIKRCTYFSRVSRAYKTHYSPTWHSKIIEQSIYIRRILPQRSIIFCLPNYKSRLIFTAIYITHYQFSVIEHSNLKALRSFYGSRYFNRQALGFAAVIAATGYIFYLYAQLLSCHNRVCRSTA